MARPKKTSKPKEPVRIREKELTNGNRSLYLDIYINGNRTREFLKMYIIPEKSHADKITNANTWQAAEAIKAQRIIDINNGKAGITLQSQTKTLFIDWMYSHAEEKERTGKRYGDTISNTIRMLVKYKGDKITMSQIDKVYCRGFFLYLDGYKQKDGSPLSSNTKYSHYSVLHGALSKAVRDGFLTSNPLDMLEQDEKPHQEEGQREFLTKPELKILADGRCRNENVKRAFMFACYCGLRLSDIQQLTWGDIIKDGKQWRFRKIQQKTGKEIYNPLPQLAIEWLPKRDGTSDTTPVFTLPHKVNIGKVLNEWAFACGINKNVTFHVSRHTFATLLLTSGGDIYTTSKLLGHTHVKTTEIYAKIVNAKKDENVGLLDSYMNS